MKYIVEQKFKRQEVELQIWKSTQLIGLLNGKQTGEKLQNKSWHKCFNVVNKLKNSRHQ